MKNEQLLAQAEMLGRQAEVLADSNVRLHAEIQEREAAERENDARDEFLAILGHELRNPLSALTSAAGLLGVKNLPAQAQERAHEVLQRQSRHLCNIVDDILDLSRLTSGKMALSQTPIDLAHIVRGCIEKLDSAVEMKRASIALDLASTEVVGDQARLIQIVTHLLNNAVNFTPASGEIHVSTGVLDDQAVFRIQDSGIGLDPALLSRVFDVFVQGLRELHRSEGGLGIGLSVVKALVKLHGGEVSAYSDGPGQGSIFEVRLPSSPALPAAADQARSSVLDGL